MTTWLNSAIFRCGVGDSFAVLRKGVRRDHAITFSYTRILTLFERDLVNKDVVKGLRAYQGVWGAVRYEH